MVPKRGGGEPPPWKLAKGYIKSPPHRQVTLLVLLKGTFGIDLNGMIVDLNGMIVDLNGMIVDLNGMIVDLNGMIVDLNGMTVDLNGMIVDFHYYNLIQINS